jgi:hypothetical protein
VENKGDYGSKDMGDIASYNGFIEFTKKKVPYEKCMLLINCHGLGVLGLSVEINPENRLTVTEMRGLQGHYDIITFASCLMGEIEVLYEIKDKSDYIVASELVMTAAGLNWKEMLEYLFEYPDASSKAFSEKIVESFKQESFVSVETSKLATVVSAMDELSKALVNGYDSGGQDYEEEVKTAIQATSYTCSGMPFIDIIDFCEEIKKTVSDTSVKNAAAKVIDSLNDNAIVKVIINNDAKNFPTGSETLSQFNGVSVFFWRDGVKGDAGKMYREIEGSYDGTLFNQETSWKQFIQKYVEKSSRNSVTVKLSADKKLNLKVVDDKGNKLGVNPKNPVNQVPEDEIPGSLYLELQDGDEIIILPESVAKFDVVIDGNVTSDYTLDYNMIMDGELVTEETMTGSFESYSTHLIPVSISGENISLGETEITKQDSKQDGILDTIIELIPGYSVETILLGLILGYLIITYTKHVRINVE